LQPQEGTFLDTT